FLRLFKLQSIDEFNSLGLWNRLDHAPSPIGQATSRSWDIRWDYEDGSSAWLEFVLSKARTANGEVFFEGIVDDITDRKRSEELLREMNGTLERKIRERSAALKLSQEHLRRSERLVSLGTLAA